MRTAWSGPVRVLGRIADADCASSLIYYTTQGHAVPSCPGQSVRQPCSNIGPQSILEQQQQQQRATLPCRFQRQTSVAPAGPRMGRQSPDGYVEWLLVWLTDRPID